MKAWEDLPSFWTSSRIGAMKMAVGVPTPRVNRKVMRGLATKRSAVGQRIHSARSEDRTAVDPCDNSNDSGLGFDHHLEVQLAAKSTLRFTDQEAYWGNEHSEVKRKKLEIKLESDDANDNFSFPDTMNRREKRGGENERLMSRNGEALGHIESTRAMVTHAENRSNAIASRRSASASLATSALNNRESKAYLQILCQPEQQHRARYQTEGSRGAVKDRSGNGFPVIKLVGYNKPATLQVFIGTDQGRVAPHMFYQACRVSGKNSTPCVERKIDGTIVIEVDFDPSKDMVITCDCVGILKERNVDVEHRFPDQSGSRNKKKSTRCRMVFRTTVTHTDGTPEVLQVTSQQIICTQPPGVPEICKKSLSTCSCTGGVELFILGKNFLKDTRVVFQHGDTSETNWEESVQPDKEFLQQTHLVCMVPPYRRVDLTEPVLVRLIVISSGKTSEPHTFTYTPSLQPPAVASEGTQPCVTLVQSTVSHAGGDVPRVFARPALMPGTGLLMSDAGANPVAPVPTKSSPKKNQYLPVESAHIAESDVHPVMMWQASPIISTAEPAKLENKSLESKELDRVLCGKMMPPPLLPIVTRRPSTNIHLIVPDTDTTALLNVNDKMKTELLEDNSSQSPEDVKGIDLRMKSATTVTSVNPIATVADLQSTQSPTMATFRQFVTGNSNTPLPTQSVQSVEKFLSRLECDSDDGNISKPVIDRLVPLCKIGDAGSQINLNRHGSESSQFEQSNTVSAVNLERKLEYEGSLSMPMIFKSQRETQECKSHFSPEDAPLLTTAIAPRRKSMYDETLAIGSTDSILSGRTPMMVMQESQSVENAISNSSLRRSLDQSVSSLINRVTDTPTVMHSSSGVMFGNPERNSAGSLLTSQSRNNEIMDNLPKENSALTVAGIVGNIREPALLSEPSLQSTSLLGSEMLAVTQAQTSIIAPSQSARLDALVSSAMNSHVLVSNDQMQSSETAKLDALVNSAAASHLMPASAITIADNTNLMNVTVPGPLRQNIPSSTDQASPIPIKKMSLDNHLTTESDLGGFDILSSQSNTQISQKNVQLLSSLLTSTNQAQPQAGDLTNGQLNINSANTSVRSGSMLYQSHERTSPIAMTNIILDSAVTTTAEGQILVTSPTRTSPVVVKSMIVNTQDSLPHTQLLPPSATSPIAMKKIIPMSIVTSPESQMVVANPVATSHAMKNILNSAITQSDDHQMIVASPNQTSPIAVKTMILEAAVASVNNEACATNPSCTSPIAVKTMILNSQLSENVGGAFEPVQAVQNARLNALVNSTLGSHNLGSSSVQVAAAINQGNNISILNSGTQLQQTPQVHTLPVVSQPLESSSHMASPVVTTGEALLNTIFASTQSPSANTSVQNHNFNKEATLIVGTESQEARCSGNSGLSQAGNLLHASQFTTASSTSQSLLTGITMPSEVAEELAAQSRANTSQFVTEVLFGLRKIDKDSELSLGSSGKLGKPLQQPGDFVPATENKISEARMFASNEIMKAALGDTPNVHIQPAIVPNHTQNHLIMTKSNQEVEQCKQQQQQQQQQQHTTTGATVTVIPGQPQKKPEEGMVPQELAQMSEHDLLSYINPSTFDQV